MPHERKLMLITLAASLAFSVRAGVCADVPNESRIRAIEQLGASVVMASPCRHTVRRIEISEIIATRTWAYDDREKRIVYGRDLHTPARFLPADAVRLLPRFGELTELSLWGSPVSDDELVHVSCLKNLRFLNLSGTKVTDVGLAKLKELTSLEELVLGATFDRGGGEMSFLNGRRYKRVPGITLTDHGLVHLRHLGSLRSLNLRATGVSDLGLASLARMSRLAHLNLVETQITDSGLRHLSKLTRLEKLEITDRVPTLDHFQGAVVRVTDTQVTSHGVTALGSRLPKCRIVFGPEACRAGDDGLQRRQPSSAKGDVTCQ